MCGPTATPVWTCLAFLGLIGFIVTMFYPLMLKDTSAELQEGCIQAAFNAPTGWPPSPPVSVSPMCNQCLSQYYGWCQINMQGSDGICLQGNQYGNTESLIPYGYYTYSCPNSRWYYHMCAPSGRRRLEDTVLTELQKYRGEGVDSSYHRPASQDSLNYTASDSFDASSSRRLQSYSWVPPPPSPQPPSYSQGADPFAEEMEGIFGTGWETTSNMLIMYFLIAFYVPLVLGFMCICFGFSCGVMGGAMSSKLPTSKSSSIQQGGCCFGWAVSVPIIFAVAYAALTYVTPYLKVAIGTGIKAVIIAMGYPAPEEDVMSRDVCINYASPALGPDSVGMCSCYAATIDALSEFQTMVTAGLVLMVLAAIAFCGTCQSYCARARHGERLLPVTPNGFLQSPHDPGANFQFSAGAGQARGVEMFGAACGMVNSGGAPSTASPVKSGGVVYNDAGPPAGNATNVQGVAVSGSFYGVGMGADPGVGSSPPIVYATAV